MPTNRRKAVNATTKIRASQRVNNRKSGVTSTRDKVSSKEDRLKVSSIANGQRKVKNQSKQKRFRKIKVLRWWVLPAVFFIPLLVLLLEYYIGRLINLDDVKDVYYQQLGIDPWEYDFSSMERLGAPPSIVNITYSPRTLECPQNQKRMINLHNPKLHHSSTRIPRILHQHSRKRCLTRAFFKATVQWAASKRSSYYFYDEDAVNRLLDRFYPEFPLLQIVATSNCIGLRSTKVELSAFLSLWLWGGIYVDLNLAPRTFDQPLVLPHEDGWFFTEPGEPRRLSTKFMAVKPRHPLMFYAIQRLLDNLLESNQDSVNATGSAALNQAFGDFSQRSFDTHQNVDANLLEGRIYHGAMNHSILVGGVIGGTEKLVALVFKDQKDLENEYMLMGETSTKDINVEPGKCLHELYKASFLIP